jgi:hypothetical protein
VLERNVAVAENLLHLKKLIEKETLRSFILLGLIDHRYNVPNGRNFLLPSTIVIANDRISKKL